MAGTRGKSGASEYPVSVRKSDTGDYSLGADIDGAFVSFVTIARDHAAALIVKSANAASSSSSTEDEEE